MRNFKLPGKAQINTVFHSFSKRERVVFFGLVIMLMISTILILESINRSFMVKIPMQGGSVSIGVIGVPRFINPVLANSEADLNMIALVYSGLMRKNSDGYIIPDLAEKYEVSKDGLSYIFTLKNNLYFQDGKPLTSDDVLFTLNKIKDGTIDSPNKVHWDGVSIEIKDEKTIIFNLKQPYASFLENTTLGIMPSHIWNNETPLELNNANTKPIGSGPYMIDVMSKKSSGIIDSYTLVPFRKFTLSQPYIKNIHLNFYQNEDELTNALFNKEVDQIGSIDPLNAENLKERNYQIESTVLPRIFGLFFNQNQNQIFTNKVVVNAINQAIDKEKIVSEVLLGYGTTINGPIPPNMIEYQKSELSSVPSGDMLQKIQENLTKDGWKTGTDGFLEKTTTENKKKTITKLAFSISTGNIPELTKTAEIIKQNLEAIGIKVDVKTFETGSLNQTVIRPRKYDALLFGQIINSESDLFAFWHSSQRKDPGLNLAMYTNVKVDKILEDAAVTVDEQSRIKKYIQFSDEVKKDMPAIFLYSPDFIYTVPKNLQNFKVENITSPSDRYFNAYRWYTETENVWKILAK